MAAERGITNQEPDELFLDPREDEENTNAFSLEDLSSDTEMYQKILLDFNSAGLEIEKIEKLQNAHLTKKYITERDLVLEQRIPQSPDFKLNEKYLYHGTSADKTQICEEGLDYRMSKQGCFGKGIYFSDYPRKCVKYAEKGGNEKCLIMLMRVIRGDAKVYPKGQKDRKLVREPEKTVPFTGFRYYDSVEGCPVNHREFVVYESRRALVECIISYRKPANPPAAGNDDNEPCLDDNNDQDASPYPQNIPPRFEDSDTSSDEADDDHDTSSDDEYYDFNQDGVTTQDSETVKPDEKLLKELEIEFFKKTGMTNKHSADVYILMADMKLDKAIAIYEEVKAQANTDEAAMSEEDLVKHLDELKVKQTTTPAQVDITKWDAMSADDKEEATKCLIDNFLDVVGKDRADDEDRQLARRYLETVKMNLDLAVIAFYEELSEVP